MKPSTIRAIAALGIVFSLAAGVNAAQVTQMANTEVPQALTDKSIFGAEGRIGSVSTWEAGAGTVASSNSSWGVRNVPWNQTGVGFQLTHTRAGGMSQFTWNIDGMSGAGTINGSVSEIINALVLRIRVGPRDAQSSAQGQLRNLQFNSSSITGLPNPFGAAPAVGVTERKYALIEGFDPLADWNLTGNVLFTWTGNAPRNSELAFQIKGLSVPVIPLPVPGAMALAGLAVVGVSRRRPI